MKSAGAPVPKVRHDGTGLWMDWICDQAGESQPESLELAGPTDATLGKKALSTALGQRAILGPLLEGSEVVAVVVVIGALHFYKMFLPWFLPWQPSRRSA